MNDSAPEAVRPRDREAILQSLRSGVVPRRGQRFIQVGRKLEVEALLRDIETIRDGGSDVPVLILTARGEEADKVLGFRLGADDYVTKPCGVLELLARVGALLRRSRLPDHRPGTAEGLERFGTVEINPASRTVTRDGTPVALSPKEFDLLLALVRRRGAVASRVELLREVWDHRVEVMTRTVDIHIAELRRKLEDDPSQPRHILTVWKAGYRLEP